jgi:general secretion pathway protein J
MNLTRNKYGFTLIEMLVALSLITLILSAVYGSWRATSRSALRMQESIRHNESGQRVGEQLTRQLRCSYYPSAESARGAANATTSGPLFKGNADAGREPILDFVTSETLSFGEEAPFGLVRAQYRFDRSSGILYYRETPYIGGHSDNQRPEWLPLAERIASVEIAYLDDKEDLDEWDSVEKSALPHEVRVTISIQGSDLSAKTFSYVTHPVCMFVRSKGV